jgi:hypothetical protein
MTHLGAFLQASAMKKFVVNKRNRKRSITKITKIPIPGMEECNHLLET